MKAIDLKIEQSMETIMHAVCEQCYFPYTLENQEDLDDRCLNCPVEKIVEAQLCAMNTTTAKEGDPV